MSYHLRLTLPEGRELEFPVLPEKLAVSVPGKQRTEEVLGLGEVLLLRPAGLRTVSWESHFPLHQAPYVSGTAENPLGLAQAIEAAVGGSKPVRLRLSGGGLALDMEAGIADFSYEERGGEVGDLYYSIKLTQWRPHGVKQVTLGEGGLEIQEAKTPRGGTPGAPKRYTVVKGDSLWAIAKGSYGDGEKWTEIYAANKAVVGPNPNKIYPGQVLTLP